MEIYAITTYVVSLEVLKILNIQDGKQACMSNAEVISFAVLEPIPKVLADALYNLAAILVRSLVGNITLILLSSRSR